MAAILALTCNRSSGVDRFAFGIEKAEVTDAKRVVPCGSLGRSHIQDPQCVRVEYPSRHIRFESGKRRGHQTGKAEVRVPETGGALLRSVGTFADDHARVH